MNRLLIFVGIVFIVSTLLGVIGFYFGIQSTRSKLPLSPVGDLQYNNTYYATSADGKAWQKGGLVRKKASVPDVVFLTADIGGFKKGDLIVYFVDVATLTGPGTEGIGIVSSSDGGKSWRPKQSAAIVGKINKGAAVDPSAVQLSDGRLRLYFFGSEITSGDPASVPGPHKVYSAISNDGVNFRVEDGVRFADEKLTDPEVIFYKNRWFMYYSVGVSSKLAISDDGLIFKAQTITGGEIGGVPGAVETSQGGVRLFGCGKGISSAVSTDGINFTYEAEDIIPAALCDPSAVRLSDGSYFMVYKVIDWPQNQYGR